MECIIIQWFLGKFVEKQMQSIFWKILFKKVSVVNGTKFKISKKKKKNK